MNAMEHLSLVDVIRASAIQLRDASRFIDGGYLKAAKHIVDNLAEGMEMCADNAHEARQEPAETHRDHQSANVVPCSTCNVTQSQIDSAIGRSRSEFDYHEPDCERRTIHNREPA